MAGWNEGIIEECRADHGKVGGTFQGASMLLTHTGRKTGSRRTNPLMYQPQHGRMFVFGSKGGAPTHPDRFLNI